jgi:hypothetical protein
VNCHDIHWQNQMALGIGEVENSAQVERDQMLAEKEVAYHCKTIIAREKMLAESKMELACLTAQYSSRNASLDVRMKIWAR